MNDAALASIVVASIGTVGTVLVALIHKFMKSNASDHVNVKSMLDMLHGDVKRVDSNLDRIESHVQRIEDKIDGHIGWHLEDK